MKEAPMSSFKRHQLKILFVACALLVLSTVANGQTITGSISGTVMDSTGGVIPGASVVLTSDKFNQARSITTDSEGRFNFAALQPGSYSLDRKSTRLNSSHGYI